MILGSLAAVLVLAEVILRLAGVSYPLHPRVEHALDPFFKEPSFERDEQLLWVKEGYADLLKRARTERPALVFMGDSCTEDGSYVRPLARLVAERRPGKELSQVNLGVGAWSSFQGLGQLRRDVADLGAKVVTFYFGWNDHWSNNDITDQEVAEMVAQPLLSLGSLRLAQLMRRAWTGAVGSTRREIAPQMRVPLERFRGNLAEMVRLAHGRGISPMLITAPTSHEPDRRPAPPPGHPNPPDLKGKVHLQYVEAVRAVAAQEKAALCDLHKRFLALPAGERKNGFTDDGIHLSEAGGRRAAGYLLACLERDGLLERVMVSAGAAPAGEAAGGQR